MHHSPAISVGRTFVSRLVPKGIEALKQQSPHLFGLATWCFKEVLYRLFPDALAQPVTEDEVTENCDGSMSSNCTGSEMAELPKLMVLFSHVCDRSPGKYNGRE